MDIGEASAALVSAIYKARRGRGLIPQGSGVLEALAENLRNRAGKHVRLRASGGVRGFTQRAKVGQGKKFGRAYRLETYLAGRVRGGHGPTGLRTGLYKAAAKTLYVSRPLINGSELAAWAKAQGFPSTLKPEDMHVTLAYSQEPMNWARLSDDYRCEPCNPDYGNAIASAGVYGDNQKMRTISGGNREVKALGSDGAVVLAFESVAFTERWAEFRRCGASWKFPSFAPHVTITYQGAGVDLAMVKPYAGDLIFGEEHWEEIDPNAQANLEEV